jgi:transposase-like protein
MTEFKSSIKLQCGIDEFEIFLENYITPKTIHDVKQRKIPTKDIPQEQKIIELKKFFKKYKEKKKRKKKRVYTKYNPTILKCPNTECSYHVAPEKNWYIYKGKYKQKWSQQTIQRFRCKKCKKTFSPFIFSESYKQHKPYLNQKILESEVSQRQTAKILGTTRKTITLKSKQTI